MREIDRRDLIPSEYDAAIRRLVMRFPWLREVRGYSPGARDLEAKHALMMADDFGVEEGYVSDFSSETVDEVLQYARHALGLWCCYQENLGDDGKPTVGMHFHFQGLRPGEVPRWWRERYWIEVEP